MIDEIADEIADDEPFAPFARWFELAMKSEPLAETMILATATGDGVPSARAVLLKGADADGLVFYTNTDSRKAEELASNPRVALCFHWKSLGRQIRIEGTAGPASNEEADAYFATRMRGANSRARDFTRFCAPARAAEVATICGCGSIASSEFTVRIAAASLLSSIGLKARTG